MAVQLSRRLLNVQEYHSMADAGILTPEDKVELIRGEVIRMSPIGKKHAYIVDRLNYLLNSRLVDQAIIRIQNPITIGTHSEPEPDVVLVKPPIDTYENRLPVPSDIIFLIEVADSSLGYDKEIKLPLYAEAEIPEVWIINLNKSIIELHKNPEKGMYKDTTTYQLDDLVPLSGFVISVSVREILGISKDI